MGFSRDARLPLKSTSRRSTVYWCLCRWFTTDRKEDLRPDRLIVCSTNYLVNEHNKEALYAFLADIMKLCSSTRVEPHASMAGRQANPVREHMQPEMAYNSFKTGLPAQKLVL